MTTSTYLSVSTLKLHSAEGAAVSHVARGGAYHLDLSGRCCIQRFTGTDCSCFRMLGLCFNSRWSTLYGPLITGGWGWWRNDDTTVVYVYIYEVEWVNQVPRQWI